MPEWGNIFILCVPLGKAGWWSLCSRGSLLPGSLAGLVDVLVDVLAGGQLRDTRLGLLVGHLGGCRSEVLITLNRTQSVNSVQDRKNQPQATGLAQEAKTLKLRV